MKTKGKVKFVNEVKAFGFIQGLDNQDYYFNVSEILTNNVRAGSVVEFDVIGASRGPKAIRITSVDNER